MIHLARSHLASCIFNYACTKKFRYTREADDAGVESRDTARLLLSLQSVFCLCTSRDAIPETSVEFRFAIRLNGIVRVAAEAYL